MLQTWMNLENMLSYISQTQKCTYYDSMHMKCPKQVNSRNRLVATKADRRGAEEKGSGCFIDAGLLKRG